VPVEDDAGLTAVVFVVPDQGSAGSLYIDDGDTADWRRQGQLIELHLRRDDAGFVLDVSTCVGVADQALREGRARCLVCSAEIELANQWFEKPSLLPTGYERYPKVCPACRWQTAANEIPVVGIENASVVLLPHRSAPGKEVRA
jgi:hypothetical protein